MKTFMQYIVNSGLYSGNLLRGVDVLSLLSPYSFLEIRSYIASR